MIKNFSITLIQCPGWGREAPPAGIALLAGNLRSKGYKVHLFDLNNELYHIVSENYKKFWNAAEHRLWRSANSMKEMMELYDAEIEAEIKKILEKGGQLVGFSVHETSLQFTLEVAKRIKRHSPDTLIVLGGPETADYPGGGLKLLENPAIDAIVLREGDETLPQMCADLKEKGHFSKIPGLVFKKDGEIVHGGERELIKSLDALPFPDYSDFDLTRYEHPGRLDIVSSRGCPYRCYFCVKNIFFQRFRFRSGESLFKEVKHHLSKSPNAGIFHFADSLLNGVPKEIEKFSELLLKNNIQINWRGEASIRKEMTADLLRKMAKAGCKLLFWGMESGSNKILKSMNKTYFTKELAAQVLKDSHEAGIKVIANFMFGYPTETEEDFQETLDFIRQNHEWIDDVNPSQGFTVIPEGSYLYEHAEEFGIDVKDGLHGLYWSTKDGKNTYPERLDHYERFCKLTWELGLGPPHAVVQENKWKSLAEYYRYKKNYQQAVDCYFKDLLKRGYSPESVKNFFECQVLAEGKEENHPLPYQGLKKLISLYDAIKPKQSK